MNANKHNFKKDLPQLFSTYILECEFSRRLRPETVRGYRSVFQFFMEIMPEIDSPETLSEEMMIEFFRRIQIRTRIVGKGTIRSGIKKSTVKTYWSKLNSFFAWLCIKNVIVENPLKRIRPPEAEYSDDRALKKEDIQKILTAIVLHSFNTFILKRDRLIVSILLFCGLRKGELLSLEVRDVDLENYILTVRGTTSKSKKTRRIPMNPTLVMHMREYFKERKQRGYKTQYLLTPHSADKGISSDGIKHWVKRISTRAGIPFHLHRFRHTFACNLARQNANAIKIQNLLGHTNLRMTAVYMRSLNVEDFRDDINRLTIDNIG